MRIRGADDAVSHRRPAPVGLAAAALSGVDQPPDMPDAAKPRTVLEVPPHSGGDDPGSPFSLSQLDLEPVELAPQLKLAGVQPVCGACSGPSGRSSSLSQGKDTHNTWTTIRGSRQSSDGDFYVQEGWFYNLPYSSGDQTRFASADFRLFLDGNEITNLVQVPMTNLDGTMISLEGYLFTDLDPGNHEMVGEWWWDDQSTFTANVEFTVSG